ncbi:MAG: carbohydrate kinase family protein, partial [Cetobacterium sp.]
TKAIDTTGAGDIFHGAFIYSLAKDYNFVKSIKFSSVCASLSVEKIGGRESIPELKNVYERMEKWQIIDSKI